MPQLPSTFQILPLHAVELVVNHLVGSSRLLDDGITSSSVEHKLLLLPLLWVCRSFRAVALAKFYRAITIKITGDDYDQDSCQYWWSTRLKAFYRSSDYHHLAREVHIILCKKGLYTGEITGVLSRAPFDGCVFPLARKFVFTFCSTAWNDFAWQDQHQEGVAVRAAEIETNISAFVQRVNQMAPMASDFEVVGSATPVNVPFDNEHIESFVSQLFQTATRAVYKVDDNNVPLELSTGIVTNLVHIDVDTTHYNSISQLVRLNAMTLQSLSIAADESGGVGGLVMDATGNFITYPLLRELRLDYQQYYNQCERPLFPGAVPFPNVRLLRCASVIPAADDVLFRGNAATLECLDVVLDLRMAAILKRYKVFTPTSHPRLRCLKLHLFYDLFQDFNGTDEERLRFLLDIVPAATVRKISSLSSSPWVYSALPVFGEYLDIKILVLPDMRLSLWNTIALIASLPLLSELHSPSPIVGQLPAQVAVNELPTYVISNHGSLSKIFRCWRTTYEVKWVNRGDIVLSVLLLALVCPNFDCTIVSSASRVPFIAHMKKLASEEMFVPYAPRLQRLLSY